MKDFDQHIKRSLDSHSSPLDTEKLWSSIESKMSAPKKAPLKPWILPLGILSGVLITASLWYGITQNNSKVNHDLLNASVHIENDKNIGEESAVSSTKLSDALSTRTAGSATGENSTSKDKLDSKTKLKEKKSKTSHIKKSQVSQTFVNSKKKENNHININSHSVKSTDKVSTNLVQTLALTPPSASFSSAPNAKVKSYVRTIESKSYNVNHDSQSRTAAYNLDGYDNSYFKNNYANQMVNADRVKRSKSVDMRKASASEARAYNKHKEKLQKTRYNLPKLPVIAASKSTFMRKGHRASDAFKIKLNRNDCPSFPIRHVSLFTDLGIGASMSRKSFTDNSNSENLIELRNISENPSLALQSSIRFGVKHKSGLAVMAGVSAYQLTEKFDYAVSTIDSSYNDLEELTVTITIKDTQQKNRYKLYDLPLTLEYTRKTGTRWSSGIQLGLIPNLSLKTNGVILNPNETVLDISKNQSEVFKSKIGLSYYASVSANYLVNSNYYVYFAPYARVIPESITQNTYALDQNYDLWGVNLGIRYFFGKGDF